MINFNMAHFNMTRPNRIILVVVAIAIQACASVETTNTNPDLEEARTAYQTAANNPHVTGSALITLNQAEDALEQAEYAWRQGNSEDVRHYSYLAKQRAKTAENIGMQSAAQQTIQDSARERDRMLIESRTLEADRARMRAEQQQLSAEQAQQSAEEQRRAAERARQEALEMQSLAEQRLQQAQTSEEKAAALEQQLNELQAKPTPRGMVLTLGDVLFDTDKSTLKPGARRSIDKLADFLQKNPEQRIRIEGHTDSTGSDQYNLELSQRRADAVRHALLDKGIGEDRMSGVEGLGEAYPVTSNNTAAGRQQNRRVEVIFPDVGNTSE